MNISNTKQIKKRIENMQICVVTVTTVEEKGNGCDRRRRGEKQPL
uniref:Uncharacterized protein n=1 Tax=Manihot esculenta TaxID=3983 RepID=A0A2C9WBG0_MANES